MTQTRQQIRDAISAISPLDPLETQTQQDVLQWIDEGHPIYRVQKPATPPKHLVSYFVLVDGDHFLLVDHINAQLWLPTGGHVEPDEHPRETVEREVMEELGIDASFAHDSPILVTTATTVGHTAGHTDVSLWYALNGDRTRPLTFDRSEFHTIKWFHKDDLPLNRTDPHLHRFVQKWFRLSSGQLPTKE